MTELHARYYAKGWVVIDVEPYLENSDLEGFFVTYAVLAKLGESILPHFPNLIADFEEALRKEAEGQEKSSDKAE
jgi:hypothetical protein